jgi:hypothetical protein
MYTVDFVELALVVLALRETVSFVFRVNTS